MENDKNFAVLIDADNISYRYIKKILDELPNDAVATYRRIYGDWTNPTLASWKQPLLDHSFTPIQQYSYTSGKNATDSAMIIDAMDILYADKVDGFCIVASDSDYTRLASRLRESGKTVIGMGETKTPTPFIHACNQFKYLDLLTASAEVAGGRQPANSNQADGLQTSLDTIVAAMQTIVEDNSDDDGWVLLSEVGSTMIKRFPDFDVRNYGFSKLTLLVKSSGKFETRSEPIQHSKNKKIYIKNK